jgi:DNA polymerase (family 10)
MKSSELSNFEIAQLFRQVAAALQIEKADIFRQRAYERAASSIEQTSQPLKLLWENKKLDEIPGLGPTFLGYLEELFSQGKVTHFETILAKMPPAMFELMKLHGVGSKTAYLLAKTFELPAGKKAFEKLRSVAEAGKIQELEGFGERSEQEILQALDEYKEEEKRMLLSTAQEIADDVSAYLQKHAAAIEIATLGSLRRKQETIGDVDIAVQTHEPEAIMEHLKKYPGIASLISSGPKMTIFRHHRGAQVDVKTQSPEKWGSMLQHYTGSKQHNIHLRSLAQEKGWSLSENGLERDGQVEIFTTEKELYATFGMQFIPPELREDKGEIQAALKNALPKLVELDDIKGDLQMHTSLDFPTSHDQGASSVTELLTVAQELGYEYIGLTDHNPPQSSLTSQEKLKILKARRQAIQSEAEQFAHQHEKAPHAIVSMEVDILPSGELALDDDCLQELDYAIASIHSSFRESPDDTTSRILRALSHKKVRILAHPTGRLLLKRASIRADWGAIFSFCAENSIFVEVNASPRRLDLPDELIRLALQSGVKVAINTDSHSAESLREMRYGVWQAQRGWATADEVVNTLSWKELKKTLL